ncbi:hypothetical protein BD408DRAFT_423193 [Parasitella parasitica]|nr:hypothetical protein BD408DRAFT_423193 [Parasitella parasitica]
MCTITFIKNGSLCVKQSNRRCLCLQFCLYSQCILKKQKYMALFMIFVSLLERLQVSFFFFYMLRTHQEYCYEYFSRSFGKASMVHIDEKSPMDLK